jgi:hypothetical protein
MLNIIEKDPNTMTKLKIWRRILRAKLIKPMKPFKRVSFLKLKVRKN